MSSDPSEWTSPDGRYAGGAGRAPSAPLSLPGAILPTIFERRQGIILGVRLGSVIWTSHSSLKFSVYLPSRNVPKPKPFGKTFCFWSILYGRSIEQINVYNEQVSKGPARSNALLLHDRLWWWITDAPHSLDCCPQSESVTKRMLGKGSAEVRLVTESEIPPLESHFFGSKHCPT